MNYNDMIKQVGKMINPRLYQLSNVGDYDYEIEDNKYFYKRNDVIRIRHFYSSSITGTVMRGLEVETKIKLPQSVYFQNTVSYQGDNATKDFGLFMLKEEPSYNVDNKMYTHYFYDSMLTSMIPYVELNITYPTTLQTFFEALCNRLYYNTSIILPNGSKEIKSDLFKGLNFTYRDVLDDIANANGMLFKMAGNDLVVCDFGTTTNVINEDILKNRNVDIGRHYGPINTITVTRNYGKDVINYPASYSGTKIEYKINNSVLLSGEDRADYLQAIYNRLNGKEFDLFDAELKGWGGFEPLEKVGISINENGTTKTYNSYILNNEIVFTQGYKEDIGAEEPNEVTGSYVSTPKEQQAISINDSSYVKEVITEDGEKALDNTLFRIMYQDQVRGYLRGLADSGDIMLLDDNGNEIIHLNSSTEDSSLDRDTSPLVQLYTNEGVAWENHKEAIKIAKSWNAEDYSKLYAMKYLIHEASTGYGYVFDTEIGSTRIRLMTTHTDHSLDYVDILGGSSTPEVRVGQYNGVQYTETRVTPTGVNQSSRAEVKKNIEEYKNALEDIKKTDIYLYNYKSEEDNHKKHIGFVIGDNYNYSSKITAINEDNKETGVDLYSMSSLCLQAIKEQQKEIEELQKKVALLESKINDKIKREV